MLGCILFFFYVNCEGSLFISMNGFLHYILLLINIHCLNKLPNLMPRTFIFERFLLLSSSINACHVLHERDTMDGEIPTHTYGWWDSHTHLWMVRFPHTLMDGEIPTHTYGWWDSHTHLWMVRFPHTLMDGEIPTHIFMDGEIPTHTYGWWDSHTHLWLMTFLHTLWMVTFFRTLLYWRPYNIFVP